MRANKLAHTQQNLTNMASPSPDSHGAERERSRSPPREDSRPKKQKLGGFKWKDKRPADGNKAGEEDKSLKRGYRDRSPRRDRYDDRDRGNTRDRSPRQRDKNTDSYRPDPRKEPEPLDRVSSSARDRPAPADKPASKPKKSKPKVTAPSGPMIVVNINDRLGTKAAIPCLASDSVKAFRAMVAVHIGRQPHEIMIKRQGERPFKDQLTLEDYGVSNGVQLDLEIDTGD